jgi:hypothetical protein
LSEAFKNPAMQKIAWDITWENFGAEELQIHDSKQSIVAARDGFLERKSKITSQHAQPMSAFEGKADMTRTCADVCF